MERNYKIVLVTPGSLIGIYPKTTQALLNISGTGQHDTTFRGQFVQNYHLDLKPGGCYEKEKPKNIF
jgi:hypothetical protein